MQIIKVFNKSYDAPSGILSSRFITKNGRKITLILSDSKLYRISDKGVKMASLSSHLRFQIKSNKQQNYLILETDLLQQILKNVFYQIQQIIPKPIEYQFIELPGMWEILLKQKLPLMDYQKYYEIEKLIGSGGFASVYIGKSKADGIIGFYINQNQLNIVQYQSSNQGFPQKNAHVIRSNIMENYNKQINDRNKLIMKQK